ncbi:MAG: FtsX-like permease family protein [Thermoguttaceae bacterium]
MNDETRLLPLISHMTWLRFVFLAMRRDVVVAVLTAVGIASATAVMVGALVLGDSVRVSLRELALARLGTVESVVVAQRLFTPPENCGTPAIILPAAVETDSRSVGVDLIALPNIDAKDDGAVVSESLATRLALSVGDTLRLRIQTPTTIPQETTLGHTGETPLRATIRIATIGTERFTMRASQQEPLTVYVPLDWLQKRLPHANNRVNTLLLNAEDVPKWDNVRTVTARDIGIKIVSDDAATYISCDKLLFTPREADAIRAELAGGVTEAFINLAESIRCGERTIPYSTVAAITGADIADDEVVLNSWAAEQLAATTLAANVGDTVELTIFDPNSFGETVARRTISRRVARIEPMHGIYAAPLVVPEIEGVTDVATIADWKPPFPFDIKAIRPADDVYWLKHRAAPKAFVSKNSAEKLWQTRFGATTTFIVSPPQTIDANDFASQLFAKNRETFGFVTIPLRTQIETASAGTTPFGVLFLALSFFVLFASAMLIVLLVQLLIERREGETRLLAVLGFSPRAVRWRLACECGVVAAAGKFIGIPLGIAYATILVYGLSTWWRDAIVVPFVTLHIETMSLIIGGGIGMTLALGVILWQTMNRMDSRRVRGHDETHREHEQRETMSLTLRIVRATTSPIPVTAMLVGLTFLAQNAEGELQRAAAFFGVGAYALALPLLLFTRWVNRDERVHVQSSSLTTRTLFALAVNSARRNPTRTLTTVALIASAAFLVMSMGAFRWTGSDDLASRDSGTGGFSLVVETRLPIFTNINDAANRESLGATDADETLWRESQTQVFACRVRDGDDASCQNLYQSRSPRIVGLPKSFVARGGFAFSGLGADASREVWSRLARPAKKDADGVWRVPTILDESTALYALHLSGVGATFREERENGVIVEYEVVGLLSGSLFQGDLLVSEENLLTVFPDVSGVRLFAIETRDAAGASAIFRRMFGDFGAVDETARERLTRFFSVQNSYLSIFESLGGLGLLLGVVGLAVVQFRSVASRRAEFTTMEAFGFSRVRLATLIVLEVVVVVLLASAMALVASTFAVLPRLETGSAAMIAFALSAAWTLGGTLLVAFSSSLIALSARR